MKGYMINNKNYKVGDIINIKNMNDIDVPCIWLNPLEATIDCTLKPGLSFCEVEFCDISVPSIPYLCEVQNGIEKCTVLCILSFETMLLIGHEYIGLLAEKTSSFSEKGTSDEVKITNNNGVYEMTQVRFPRSSVIMSTQQSNKVEIKNYKSALFCGCDDKINVDVENSCTIINVSKYSDKGNINVKGENNTVNAVGCNINATMHYGKLNGINSFIVYSGSNTIINATKSRLCVSNGLNDTINIYGNTVANIDSGCATINIFGNNSKVNINSSGNCRNIKVTIYANNTRVCSQGEATTIECYGVGSMISCYGEESVVRAKKGNWITIAKYQEPEEDDWGFTPYSIKNIETIYVDNNLAKGNEFYEVITNKIID